MFGIGKRQPATVGITQPEPAPDVLTTAGRLARREGQIITVDRLTTDALMSGTEFVSAIDIRQALGLPMPGGEGGSRG